MRNVVVAPVGQISSYNSLYFYTTNKEETPECSESFPIRCQKEEIFAILERYNFCAIHHFLEEEAETQEKYFCTIYRTLFFGKELYFRFNENVNSDTKARKEKGKSPVFLIDFCGNKHDCDVLEKAFLSIHKEEEKKKDNLNHFYTLRLKYEHLSLHENIVSKIDVNLNENYNDGFDKIHETFVEKLKTSESGLFLLHGPPGTGKTSYIRHLNLCVPERKFIFILKEQAHYFKDLSFISFLTSNPNSIIVIEDAEQVILDRKQETSVQDAILNITDGILGSITKTSIILSFNMEKTNIDKAFLRKGRLKFEYRFEPLQTNKANALLKKLGKNFVTKEPMNLCDIYYHDEETSTVERKQTSIGFKQ